MLKCPNEQKTGGELEFSDPLIPLARQLILGHRDASITLLQRHLRVGFTRAKGLHAALEGTLVTVPSADGSRQVIGAEACIDSMHVSMEMLHATTATLNLKSH